MRPASQAWLARRVRRWRAATRRSGVEKGFITAFTINAAWERYQLPDDLDLLSSDVDGQEYWIWLALDRRPKIVVIEYNGSIPLEACCTMTFDLAHMWDGTTYSGSSLRAMAKLGEAKGYVLVWANGVNAIFVRDDLVSNPQDFVIEDIYRSYPSHAFDHQYRGWVAV